MLIVSLKPESDDDAVFLDTRSGRIKLRVLECRSSKVQISIECEDEVEVNRAKVLARRAQTQAH